MAMPRININKGTLERLYIAKNLSPNKIGKIFSCSFSTITNRLKEYNIPLKSPAFARMRYPKANFSGDPFLGAYMIGFRLGDLNVYRPSEKSETIVIRCHTTQFDQVRIMKLLFDRFGKVGISRNSSGHFYINCYLNNSFSFLLSKHKSSWNYLVNDLRLYPSFVAGYVDAEGNFIINQGRARFKIDS